MLPRHLAVTAACLAAVTGCAGTTPGAGTTAVATPPAPSRAAASLPSCTPAPLAQRAATTLVVGLPGVTRASAPLAVRVTRLGVGGVFLTSPNVRSTSQLTALTAGLRADAGRPLLISTDEESGRVAVMRAVVGGGPSPRRLAQRPAADVRAFADGIGHRLAAVGVNLDLAPLLDLDGGPSSGLVGDRSFSTDPLVAARYGLAFAAGLRDAGVTPTVKHFPGQGRSRVDVHKGSAPPVTASLEALRATDLLPFQQAVAAGAPVVMLNHLSYDALDPDLPASMSPRAYALLRAMGFHGVAMTDSVGMGAVNLRWDFPEAAVRAVAAGADAVLATDGNQALRMRDALVAAVRSGRLPQARLDEAAARVTALAGGDPQAMSCQAMTLPRLAEPNPYPSARPIASSTP